MPTTEEGNMFPFDPQDAKITLYYSSNTTSLDDNGNQEDDDEHRQGIDTYDLTFTGVNVNVYDTKYSG